VEFTTTEDLRTHLQALADKNVGAVFHAAAVCDFTFGTIWKRNERGELIPLGERKVLTQNGNLLAELKPTPKVIAGLRGWFPKARIVGWKYELDGDRARVIQLARDQMAQNRTDACVVNGAAFGRGFGLVAPEGTCLDLADATALYPTLAKFIGA
jgi:phosphopantothenoylcysteine decarboxylase/phosphopantothenate--cysteine ligase